MTVHADEIIRTALGLPEDARAEIAAALNASLDTEQIEVTPQQVARWEARLGEMKADPGKSIPLGEYLKQLRARFARVERLPSILASTAILKKP